MKNQNASIKTPEFDFFGGIYPEENKHQTCNKPIAKLNLPERLQLSLLQTAAPALSPKVSIGERVLAGQKIADSTHAFASPLFAPLSGVISRISKQPALARHAQAIDCIELLVDKEQITLPQTSLLKDASCLNKVAQEDIANSLANSGIKGLGGAAFATHVKLAQKGIETLIINGVECEPYISCDDRLMQEYAREIILGIQAIAYFLNIKRCLFAIEENKPQAIKAIQDAINNQEPVQKHAVIELFRVPYRYPSGGEKQLIKLLTNQEVPTGKTPASIGMLCHNVGTLYAVHQRLYAGEPLLRRVVTLSGNGLDNPQNVWAPLGTPVKHLLEFAGIKNNEKLEVKIGGPLTGFSTTNQETGILAGTNAILVNKAQPNVPEQSCIRCGECTPVCPSKLLPHQLYWFAKAQEYDKAEHHNLFDCIECGACDYVCPSHIPLNDYYREAKQRIRLQQVAQAKSQQAKVRHEQRTARLEAQELEKQKRRAERKHKAATARLGPSIGEQQTTNQATNQAPNMAENGFEKEANLATAPKESNPQATQPESQNVQTSNTQTNEALDKKIRAQMDRIKKSEQRLEMAIQENLSSVDTLKRALEKQKNKLVQMQAMQEISNNE